MLLIIFSWRLFSVYFQEDCYDDEDFLLIFEYGLDVHGSRSLNILKILTYFEMTETRQLQWTNFHFLASELSTFEPINACFL